MHPDIRRFLARLEGDKTYSPNTQRAYSYDLKRLDAFLRGLGADADGAIRPEHLAAFLDAETRGGFSRRTLKRRQVVLRRLAQNLAAEGRHPDEGTRRLTLPDLDGGEEGSDPGAAPLTQAEVARITGLLSQTQSARGLRDRAILGLLLETGMQISQLVRLNLGDPLPSGDGRPGLAHALQADLDEYLKNGRPELAHSSNEAAMFISQMGSRMTRQTIWAMLRALGRAAGLDAPLTPRRLRHTAAGRMAREGLALEDLRLKLGHLSQASTAALLARLPQPP